MSYQLVVSEKPSVGAAYAKVLGATNRQDGYWEGNGYLVSWCIGHLVELAPPNVYDEKYVKWSVADLPILPEKWQYLVSASTKKQFGILKKLMHRPDVNSVICATDSGREGELIFRLVYQQAGCKKPFTRLWLSSMEENAIREGFAHLKPSTEYDALYNAALCRERADWMVGINASRLFSCLYGQPLAVGRVMTPVLAMTVVREAAIAAFTPEKFHTVALTLADGGTASSKRFAQKADAELLLSKCRKEGRVTVQKMERNRFHILIEARCLGGTAGFLHIQTEVSQLESTLKFQRGDIYFIRLDSSTGSEQSGTRPAVILQNDVGNTYSPTLIVATLTSKTEKKAAQPTHCLVEPEKLEPSIVQAEQIFTIDKSRVQNFVGHLTPEEMSRVDDAVKISLALNPMGSIQKLKPIIRSTAAYAPPEVVDGKPPVYPYTPIKSDFEDAGTVEETMLYTELQSAVHAMIQRLEYSFTFNPSLLTSPKRKKQVAEILTEAEKYIWRIKEEMRCA